MIRIAKTSDIDGILGLYRVLFAEMAKLDDERLQNAHQEYGFVEMAITNDTFQVVVAEMAGEIKGFCLAQQQSADPYNCIVPRDYAYIFDLVIDPHYRGEKLGQKLVDEIKAWATSRQLSHLELSVLAQNASAIKFYQREGFTEVSKIMAIKL